MPLQNNINGYYKKCSKGLIQNFICKIYITLSIHLAISYYISK